MITLTILLILFVTLKRFTMKETVRIWGASFILLWIAGAIIGSLFAIL